MKCGPRIFLEIILNYNGQLSLLIRIRFPYYQIKKWSHSLTSDCCILLVGHCLVYTTYERPVNLLLACVSTIKIGWKMFPFEGGHTGNWEISLSARMLIFSHISPYV